MSSDMLPPAKKIKMQETLESFIETVQNSKQNLRAVLDDSIYNPIPLVKLYAGSIKDKKKISNTILVLNEKLPLKNLQHLKRVHKSFILLCRVEVLAENNTETIEDYIEKKIPELIDVFDDINEVEVPLFPPKTKKQYTECCKNWMCNFHPNKYLERLISDSFFTDKELATHRLYMSLTIEIARYCFSKVNLNYTTEDLLSSNAAIVVDPTINSIVAISFDNRKENPIQHAAMIAIDNVAKTQNGGVWNNLTTDNVVLTKKFDTIKFGYRKYLNKKEMSDMEQLNCPYLCTGYYIYLLREPCLMCAMGLVHARIKRVFFCYDNLDFGALKTKTKLHCVSSLNHHFEVFSGFC